MDEMHPFERQVSAEVVREMRPSRPVDAVAVIAAVDAVRSPKWRFQSMFSATKFVVAGAVVALFGGFLLTSVMTQPSDEQLPAVGASASATTQAEPSDATTSEPEPTTEVETDTSTIANDLLPGVEPELREVGPGIYHVLGDGSHDLTQNVWDVEITPHGEVWVEKHRVKYGPKQNRDDRLRSFHRDARVLRLGEPGAMHKVPDDVNDRLFLHLDLQGDVGVRGTEEGVGVWRDGAWQEPVDPYCEGLLSAGACWQPDWEGPGIVRIDSADGSQRRFTHEDLGFDADDRFGTRFALGDDGILWTDTHDGNPYTTDEPDGVFTGLASYDGERWATVEMDEAVPGFADKLAVAPDGTVWVVLREPDWVRGNPNATKLTVAKWDGTTWDTFGPVEGYWGGWWNPDIPFTRDGTAWFDATTFYDGSDLRQVEIPAAVTDGELRVGPYAFGPDGSVWVVLIDMRDPKSLGCEVDPRVCEGVAALYVITPEAVEATD